LDFFKSNRSWTWPNLGIQIQPGTDLEKLVFGSQNDTPDETNDVNNTARSYKEGVEFSAFFVLSLLASFLPKFVEHWQ